MNLAARILVALALTALSACFTTTLWTQDSPDECDREAQRDSLKIQLFLTPFSLLLDLLTWPAQRRWWEDRNDDC